MREGVLWLNPSLPMELKSVRSRIQYRGHWFGLYITHEKLEVSFEGAWAPYARIGVNGKIYTFKRGETKEFALVSKVASDSTD
jgi:trehalose/maltose hydrolase-like predicted phosphorylase